MYFKILQYFSSYGSRRRPLNRSSPISAAANLRAPSREVPPPKRRRGAAEAAEAAEAEGGEAAKVDRSGR